MLLPLPSLTLVSVQSGVGDERQYRYTRNPRHEFPKQLKPLDRHLRHHQRHPGDPQGKCFCLFHHLHLYRCSRGSAMNDSTGTREIPGTSSLSSSSRLTAISGTISDIPVIHKENAFASSITYTCIGAVGGRR